MDRWLVTTTALVRRSVERDGAQALHVVPPHDGRHQRTRWVRELDEVSWRVLNCQRGRVGILQAEPDGTTTTTTTTTTVTTIVTVTNVANVAILGKVIAGEIIANGYHPEHPIANHDPIAQYGDRFDVAPRY